MNKIVCGVVAVAAVFLGGCDDKAGAEHPAQQAAAPAAGQVTATPAAPAAPAKPETPRVGHRMQLEPLTSDKFNLGPKATGGAKPDGSK